MRWWRILIAAIAVTVFGALFGAVTCGWLFKWIYAIPPTEIWKTAEAMVGNFWIILYAGNFILAFILAAVFGWIYKSLPAKCCCCRGSAFGLIVWLVGMLPGMFSMYMFTLVAPEVLLYWAISGFVGLQIDGLIISAIYGSSDGSCGCGC